MVDIYPSQFIEKHISAMLGGVYSHAVTADLASVPLVWQAII